MTVDSTTRRRRLRRGGAVLALAASGTFAFGSTAGTLAASAATTAKAKITTVSTDPYKNTSSYHQTELEPDNYAWGDTEVAVFQTGRFNNGGSDNTGYATTTDGGKTWKDGFLPGTTPYSDPPGPYQRLSDPSVGYDAKHDVWMINSLTVDTKNSLIVDLSTDGGKTFGKPIVISTPSGSSDYDKNWISCDNWKDSPSYGNCYVEVDDNGLGNVMDMFRTTDGGKHWTQASVASATGLGGQPVSQPDGTVIVPFSANFSALQSLVSTDGGKTYTGPYNISNQTDHVVPNVRTEPLPSAEVDNKGNVYVAWQDCRFRASCASNDIVMSTSSDGKKWSDVVRIPIDAVSSSVDHFIPGLGVDRSTGGSSAKLALTYYYFPKASCTLTTCQLDVGYVSSTDAGKNWTAPKKVLGPLSLTWLPDAGGRFVGDYISTSFMGNKAFPVVASATKGACTLGDVKSCHEFMAAPTKGLPVKAGTIPVGHESVSGAPSDRVRSLNPTAF